MSYQTIYPGGSGFLVPELKLQAVGLSLSSEAWPVVLLLCQHCNFSRVRDFNFTFSDEPRLGALAGQYCGSVVWMDCYEQQFGFSSPGP